MYDEDLRQCAQGARIARVAQAYISASPVDMVDEPSLIVDNLARATLPCEDVDERAVLVSLVEQAEHIGEVNGLGHGKMGRWKY